MAETIVAADDRSAVAESQVAHISRDGIWAIQGWGLVSLVFLSFFPRLFHLEEYLFFGLLSMAVLVAWRSRQSIWVRTSIDLPLLLFVGWVLVTIPFATDPAYSFAEWRKIATQVLVFHWALLVLRVHHDGPMTRRMLIALVLGTVLLCGYAFTDFLSRGGTWRDRHVRAAAPYSDYNWLSTYMVIAIPLLVAVTVGCRTWWSRAASGAVAVLALVTQVVSYTRAGWLGIMAQALSWGFLTARRHQAMAIIVGCVLLVGGLFAVSQMGYQRDTIDPWTLNARLAVWKLGLGDVLEHPFVGVGYGSDTFMKRFAGYPETIKANGPHSAFLMVAMGSGVPALAFLIWIFVGSIVALVRLSKRVPDRISHAAIIAVAVMIVGFATRNMFDYMFAGSLAYLFWILLALGLAQKYTIKEEAKIKGEECVG
jgi:putative inorganic carbon (HCO3(-)) transporter